MAISNSSGMDATTAPVAAQATLISMAPVTALPLLNTFPGDWTDPGRLQINVFKLFITNSIFAEVEYEQKK